MISGGLSFLPGNYQLKLKNRRFSDITDFTQILMLYSLSRKNFLEFFLEMYHGYVVEICLELVGQDIVQLLQLLLLLQR